MKSLQDLTAPQAELALTLCDASLLNVLSGVPAPYALSDLMGALGWREPPLPVGQLSLNRLYFGNEFCERLLPRSSQVEQVVQWCRVRDLPLTLLTPMLADKGIGQLSPVLQQLPEGSEVVLNDWGVLRVLKRHFPHLRPVAGRQMCKMIKDPRLPSSEWAQAIPPGSQSSLFPRLMRRFGIESVETDLRPFAEMRDLQPNGLGLSVHFPYGYTLKGRICKPGSLGLEKRRKFMPGHSCQRECLDYFSRMQRTGYQSPHELPGFQRGNTIFYRYGETQEQVLAHALEQGWVERLVLAGDWNEHRCTNQ